MSKTNEQWQQILETIPSTLKSHFAGSTASLGDSGLIVSLPSQSANIPMIKKQIEKRYIKPKVNQYFGDVAISYQQSLPAMPEPQERIRVIDRRKPRYFRIDNELFDDGHANLMKPSGLAVYLVLCRHADYESNDCFPSYKTISKKAGVSRPTAIKHIKRLDELGYIEIKHNFNSNGDSMSNTFFVNELPIIKFS